MEGISIVSTNLTDGDDFLRKKINALLQTYKLELKSLSKILGVDYTWLKDFIDRKK
ncbi:hypothetical protein CSC2_09130 [Clostridium zeae]|uniref:Uncharacterized protein n=1 Tax=Clostridium zeae TaxID=2759022 RepID=A0ABQ1E6I7_9CLOT|nr:HTH domain-containing protein [Clostridium zeae]GFZ30387.1 hypothetical protein CSC2_09130 [Clostridium zeae]